MALTERRPARRGVWPFVPKRDDKALAGGLRRREDSCSCGETALLEFLAAAAGTRVVATDIAQWIDVGRVERIVFGAGAIFIFTFSASVSVVIAKNPGLERSDRVVEGQNFKIVKSRKPGRIVASERDDLLEVDEPEVEGIEQALPGQKGGVHLEVLVAERRRSNNTN